MQFWYFDKFIAVNKPSLFRNRIDAILIVCEDTNISGADPNIDPKCDLVKKITLLNCIALPLQKNKKGA